MKVSLSKAKDQTFFDRHGLTIVTSCILLAWIVLYNVSDQAKHIGFSAIEHNSLEGRLSGGGRSLLLVPISELPNR